MNKIKFIDIISIALPIGLMLFVVLDNISIFYITLAISLFFITKPLLLYPLFFISSLSTTFFSLSDGTSAGRYISILFIFSLALKCILDKKKLINEYFIICSIILIYSFFSASISVTGSFSPFFQMLVNILIFYFIQIQITKETHRLLTVLFWSSLGVLLVLMIQVIKVGPLLFESRYMFDDVNSNRLSMMCCQLGGIIFFPFILPKSKITIKILSLIGTVLALMIIVLSGSRSALIGLLGSIFLILIIVQRKEIKKHVIPIVILIMVGFLIIHYLEQIDSPVINRFTIEAIIDSGGTGRMDLIRIVMKDIFPSNMLFGVGIGSENILQIGHKYGLTRPAHNIIVDPLSQLGIVGFSIYLCLIIPLIKKTWKLAQNKESMSYVAILLLFCGILNGIGEVIIYEKFFWSSLALCALMYNNRNTSEVVK